MNPFKPKRILPTPRKANLSRLECSLSSRIPIFNGIPHVGINLKGKEEAISSCRPHSIFDVPYSFEGGGVYLIGDFYIGRSYDIFDRLCFHSPSIEYSSNDAVGYGARDFFDRYGECLIPVFKLSEYPEDEKEIIRIAIKSGLPLYNRKNGGWNEIAQKKRERNIEEYIIFKTGTRDQRLKYLSKY